MEYLLHWRRTEPQAQGRASCTWLKGMVRVSPRCIFVKIRITAAGRKELRLLGSKFVFFV